MDANIDKPNDVYLVKTQISGKIYIRRSCSIWKLQTN